MFDAASRMIFFGAWLYSINNGNFSAYLTILYFYSVTLVCFLSNLLFSCFEKMEKTMSFRNLLGNYDLQWLKLINLIQLNFF